MGRHSKAYGAMTQELKDKYDATVKQLASLGISGMMHGYRLMTMTIYSFHLERGVITMLIAEILRRFPSKYS